MHKQTSVFSNPITEKKFLQHLDEKRKREFENFKRKKDIIEGDNSSEQIINTISEKL